MIRLEKVDKYFNKGKANEIHVINNTTLELPESGIVTLLGPSGSGKTTLLNVVGGLDRFNRGKMTIEGKRIGRHRSGRFDRLRNAKIGYIFQNFNLLDDRTVFDNVALALRMIGIRNKRVVQERVNYCLKAVGIYAYRNRLAGSISGGQRQRVAIARAIVKNPRIIIADEPTGNLDSANTLEVMNIIKRISEERLVLLVTHEEELAEFYSDRTIRIMDGKVVSDVTNDTEGKLDYQLENKIYLKDMPYADYLGAGDVIVDLYADRPREADIKLVLRGGNLFIDTGGKYTVVDENSDIELVDEHYTAYDKSFFEENKFDYNAFLPRRYRVRYKSIYGLIGSIVRGFGRIRSFRMLKKLLLLGFVLAAAFMFFAVSHIAGVRDIQRTDFMQTNDHYITVPDPGKSEKLLKYISKMEGVEYVIPGTSEVNFVLPLDDYYQTTTLNADLPGSLVSAETLNEANIYMGKLPEKSDEVAVDLSILTRFLRNKAGGAVNLHSYRQFLGRSIRVPNLDPYVITAIVDTQSPSIFAQPDQFTNIIANAPEVLESDQAMGNNVSEVGEELAQAVRPWSLAPKSVKLKQGRLPKDDYETIVNIEFKDDMPLNKKVEKTMNGKKLTVVGYYTTNRYGADTYYVTDHMIELDNLSRNRKLSVYATDVDMTKTDLEMADIASTINFDRERAAYVESIKGKLRTSLVLAAVILLISLIEIYLMLRSSFLSRIREIGILRAIGVKKGDIYRMFAGEIVAITLVTSVIGIGVMYYIMSNVVKLSYYYQDMYMVNPAIAGITLGAELLFNLVIGLIPVFRTMRKTPAEILSRTDI